MLRNVILSKLKPSDQERLQSSLMHQHLEEGRALANAFEPIGHVYFPLSGLLSFVVDLPGGGAIETGMVGRDGVFGASHALDERLALNRTTVQMPGEAFSIPSSDFTRIVLDMPDLRKFTLGYEQFFLAQVQQTAACNALHTVLQRMCRWLLRIQYLVGDEFPLTQEFLSQMIGVRRTSVTTVAQQLQAAGLIEYKRGQMSVKDREGIRSWACECDDEILSRFQEFSR